MTEVEKPDPEKLRRRAAEASADAARARPTMMGGAGPPVRSHGAVQWRDVRNDRTAAAAMIPTVKNQQRDFSESLAQLCNCVPLSP